MISYYYRRVNIFYILIYANQRLSSKSILYPKFVFILLKGEKLTSSEINMVCVQIFVPQIFSNDKTTNKLHVLVNL